MKTAIMTDTNSGISAKEIAELGIYAISMPVIIDGEVYFEGQTITEEEFFDALRSGKDVSTSQPSPGEVLAMWDQILADGYDELVYIPMSSALSTSCATAKALADDYDGKVEVADNHRISLTQHDSVIRALSMAKGGKSAAEIKQQLEEEAYTASIYLTVNTLEYLKKGGRVTPAAAMIGTLLSIKPILSIQGEKLDAFTKVRGPMKKCYKTMIKALQKDMETRFADCDQSKLSVGVAGAGLSAEEIADATGILQEAFPQAKVYYDPLSASISCHTGPGAVGMGISFR